MYFHHTQFHLIIDIWNIVNTSSIKLDDRELIKEKESYSKNVSLIDERHRQNREEEKRI
jgi:hypothetical protein